MSAPLLPAPLLILPVMFQSPVPPIDAPRAHAPTRPATAALSARVDARVGARDAIAGPIEVAVARHDDGSADELTMDLRWLDAADLDFDLTPSLLHLRDDHPVGAVVRLQESLEDQAMEEAAFLGVGTEPVQPETAAQLPIRRGTGLLVVTVVDGSPAAAAGLARFDVLARLDDQILVNPEQLAVLIRSYAPGESVRLTYLRGGTERTATVTLASRMQPVLAPGGRRPGLALSPGRFDDARSARWPDIESWGRAVQQFLDAQRRMRDQDPQLQSMAQVRQAVEQMRKAMEMARRELAQMRDSAAWPGRSSERTEGSEPPSGHDAEHDRDRGGDSGAMRGTGGSSSVQSSFDSQTSSSFREVSTRAEQMVWDDGQTRIERSRRDGAVEFVIHHRGREVYRGPEPTPADRDRLEPLVREKLLEFSRVTLPAPPAPPSGRGQPAPPRIRLAPVPPPPPPPPTPVH